MSESEKFHLQLDVDQEYKKFCFELIQRETEGEKIDYEKESINFCNQKLKKAVNNQKSD